MGFFHEFNMWDPFPEQFFSLQASKFQIECTCLSGEWIVKITCPNVPFTCLKYIKPCNLCEYQKYAVIHRTSAAGIPLVWLSFLLVSDDRTSGISNPVNMTQIQWKFYSALLKVVAKWLLWKFAHGMAALLLWHVQNCAVICCPRMELHWNKFSI